MRWIRRLMAGVLILLLVVVVGGAGLAWFTTRASFPQVSGTVTVAGLGAAVEVRRDEYGMPQITADTAEDLFMAQGYVHAQDRFWEMDFRRHVTAGRLSELFGDGQVETDAFIRTLGWRRVAEQELALLSPDTRALPPGLCRRGERLPRRPRRVQPVARVRRARPAELATTSPSRGPRPTRWRGSRPWPGTCAATWTRRSTACASRPDLSDDQLADLDPPYPYDRAPVDRRPTRRMTASASTPTASAARSRPSTSRAVAARLAPIAGVTARLPGAPGHGRGDGIGSNSFVVDGSRPTTGKPLLANDPHLGPSMPGIWYQVGPALPHAVRRLPVRRDRLHVLRRPGGRDRAQRPDRLGLHQPRSRREDLYLEDVQGDAVPGRTARCSTSTSGPRRSRSPAATR